jgi:hypothetical protein
MLKWLLLLIDYWPTIYRIASEILALIKKLPKTDHSTYKTQLKDAITYFRTTKKSSLLKTLHKKLREKINGKQQ